jgi:MOSC domain-containing protein YiiM
VSDTDPTLKERLARVPQVGVVRWIGVRPGREVPMNVVAEVTAIEGRGLEGDRASASGKVGGKRQVTLILREHLDVVARLTGKEAVAPELVRRNLVIEGVNLVALKRMRFSIGDEVVLEGSGPCEPCSKMDASLGDGGFHAMRGHGGITARIVRGGRLRVGDPVRALALAEAPEDEP